MPTRKEKADSVLQLSAASEANVRQRVQVFALVATVLLQPFELASVPLLGLLALRRVRLRGAKTSSAR